MNEYLIPLLLTIILVACSNQKTESDAYGYFQTETATVSSETAGLIEELHLEEGDILLAGKPIGQIDSMNLHFKKQQLMANLKVLQANALQVTSQAEVIEQQMVNLERDQKRVKNLLDAGSATQKQADDIESQMLVLEKQKASIIAQQQTLESQQAQIYSQIDELNYNLKKTILTNPVEGTVLSKIAMKGEITAPGKPLYEIANMKFLTLKAYISGDILPDVKLNQSVTVVVDDGQGHLKEINGVVNWISEQAEFTPKTIQTREERVNLVYAVKIRVENDGSIKIGMPGEVKFAK